MIGLSQHCKMKVLLIQPPVQDFYETKIRLQPIGLAYLKAVVKKYLPSVEIKIIDYHHGHGRKSIPLPAELKYLRDFYPYPDKSPFALFYHYYHFGADFERIATEVAAENPDLVGISCLFSAYYLETLATAHAIKAKLDVPIVIGGAHALPDGIEPHDAAADFLLLENETAQGIAVVSHRVTPSLSLAACRAAAGSPDRGSPCPASPS